MLCLLVWILKEMIAVVSACGLRFVDGAVLRWVVHLSDMHCDCRLQWLAAVQICYQVRGHTYRINTKQWKDQYRAVKILTSAHRRPLERVGALIEKTVQWWFGVFFKNKLKRFKQEKDWVINDWTIEIELLNYRTEKNYSTRRDRTQPS